MVHAHHNSLRAGSTSYAMSSATRLLQEMVSAGSSPCEPLGRGVAADDESWNRCAQRLANVLDDLDAGFTISETKVGM